MVQCRHPYIHHTSAALGLERLLSHQTHQCWITKDFLIFDYTCLSKWSIDTINNTLPAGVTNVFLGWSSLFFNPLVSEVGQHDNFLKGSTALHPWPDGLKNPLLSLQTTSPSCLKVVVSVSVTKFVSRNRVVSHSLLTVLASIARPLCVNDLSTA